MRRRIDLSPRREPRQARSRQMREDILTAAVRVLRREGAVRFTTPRVAEAAGISVGSLYQYFPNKQALLYALHLRAVLEGWSGVQAILDDRRLRPRDKLRRIARLFFVAESEDVAQMGSGLAEIDLWFADQPEQRAIEAAALARLETLLREARPRSTAAQVRFTAQLMAVTLESTGKAVAQLRLARPAVEKWARACADMIADYARV